MSSSAITTQLAQLKVGNVQNQADSSSVYSAGEWSFKNSTAVTNFSITDTGAFTLGPSNSNSLDSTIFAKQVTQSSNSPFGTRYIFTSTSTNGRTWQIGSNFSTGTGEFSIYDASANAERMRIDASGLLTVGSTSPSNNLEIVRVNAPGNSYNAIGIVSTDNASNAIYMAFRRSDAALIASIRRSGTTDAVVYNTTASDYRLKEDVQDLSGGLDKIKALRPVSFTWKESKQKDIGFIAHELQSVVPECITGEKDAVTAEGTPDYQSLFPAPAQMIANLVAAIQELSAKVEEQSSRIDAQAEEIKALKAQP